MFEEGLASGAINPFASPEEQRRIQREDDDDVSSDTFKIGEVTVKTNDLVYATKEATEKRDMLVDVDNRPACMKFGEPGKVRKITTEKFLGIPVSTKVDVQCKLEGPDVSHIETFTPDELRLAPPSEEILVSEDQLKRVRIGDRNLGKGNKIYVKEEVPGKCLKYGEESSIEDVILRKFPNKSEVLVKCVSPQGKTDLYYPYQLSPTNVVPKTINVSDGEVQLGQYVYLNPDVPGNRDRCLQRNIGGRAISYDRFSGRGVKVVCSDGSSSNYSLYELVSKQPESRRISEGDENALPPHKRPINETNPSIPINTCNDSAGNELVVGNFVKSDWIAPVEIESMFKRNNDDACYLRLKTAIDDRGTNIITSDFVEKTEDPSGSPPPTEEEKINLQRAIEAARARSLEIPPDCKGFNNETEFKPGERVVVFIREGQPGYLSEIVRADPRINPFGQAGRCNILVRLLDSPGQTETRGVLTQQIRRATPAEIAAYENSGRTGGETLRNRRYGRHTKKHSYGGGPSRKRGKNPPQGNQRGNTNQPKTPSDKLDDVGDLIDYTQAYASFGIPKTDMKNKLEAFIKLVGTPGAPVPPQYTPDPKNTTVKYTVYNPKAASNTYIFESPKGITDSIIISVLTKLSKIGTAIVPLVNKLNLIKRFIYANLTKPIFTDDFSDLTDQIAQDAKKVGADKVLFNLTPLQYAILVGNKDILHQLITANAPISENQTRTDPSADGTTYTIQELVAKRDDSDPRKEEVVKRVNDIITVRKKALADYRRPTPAKDIKYVESLKDEGSDDYIMKFVYNKTFDEAMEGKAIKDADQIEYSQIVYKATIDKAKEDARKIDPNTKVQGVPDPRLYNLVGWKTSGISTPEQTMYTKYYTIERAIIQAEIDSQRDPPIKTAEYSRPEYNKPPLRAIKDAYMLEFNKRTARDYDRGFRDGLAGQEFAEYIAGPGGKLESVFAQIIYGTAGTTGVSDYKRGYLQGINQLINSSATGPGTPPSISSGYYLVALQSAKRAGIIDATVSGGPNPRYTTPATYYASDTRSATGPAGQTRSFDPSKKELPVQIFLDKLIKNYKDIAYNQPPTPAEVIQGTARQKMIDKLKEEYDRAYGESQVQEGRRTYGPQEEAPGVTRRSLGGSSRKHKSHSPKRSTLRRK